MTNHYWDRVTAPHADRDPTAPPTDRDADSVPSDRVRAYADLIGRLWLTTTDGGTYSIEDIARVCVELEDDEIDRRRRFWMQQTAMAHAARRKAEAANARVEALADQWDEYGEDSAMWRAFGPQSIGVPFAVKEVRAALRGPVPKPIEDES